MSRDTAFSKQAGKETSKDAGPRRALGRGLAALMPTAPATQGVDLNKPTASAAGFRVLPVERLHGNKRQPRKQFDEAALAELAESVATQGILQPIVVRRDADGYEIVAGERRWRAATRAGLREVPVVIKELTDSAALQVALIENIQRQDLDVLEEAEAYGRLIREHNLTHEQVATSVSKSRAAITNSLRLLKLPDEVLVMLADGRLTAGHARALMSVDDKKVVLRLAEDLAGRRASVREAEAQARRHSRTNRRQSPVDKPSQSPGAGLEERLQRHFGTRCRIVERNGKGHVEMHFHSLQALDGLLDRLLS